MKPIWDSQIFSINNTISFQYDSSYENSNLISGDKLIKSKLLQNKLKTFLIEEASKVYSRSNTNNNLYKNSLNESINNENRNIMNNIIRTSKKISPSNKYSNKMNKLSSLQLLKNKNKKKIKNFSNLMSKRSRTINSNSQSFKHSSSFNETNNLKYRKNKYKTGIGYELFDNSHTNIKMINKLSNKRKSSKSLLFGNLNLLNNNNKVTFNNSKEIQKKINKKRRNSIIITHFPQNKKKDLLSQINFNIQKTNQNLNNPDEFYSSYFNFLLEGELEKNNLKSNKKKDLLSTSLIIPRNKEKTNKNRNYILKK